MINNPYYKYASRRSATLGINVTVATSNPLAANAIKRHLITLEKNKKISATVAKPESKSKEKIPTKKETSSQKAQKTDNNKEVKKK